MPINWIEDRSLLETLPCPKTYPSAVAYFDFPASCISVLKRMEFLGFRYTAAGAEKDVECLTALPVQRFVELIYNPSC